MLKRSWKGDYIRYNTFKLLLLNKKLYLKDSNIVLFPILSGICKNFFIYNGKSYYIVKLEKRKFFLKLNLFLISKKIGILIHKKKNKKLRKTR